MAFGNDDHVSACSVDESVVTYRDLRYHRLRRVAVGPGRRSTLAVVKQSPI